MRRVDALQFRAQGIGLRVEVFGLREKGFWGLGIGESRTVVWGN